MAGTVCYLKLNRNVEVMEDSVFLKDVGSVYCADKLVTAKVKSMKLHHFEKGQGSRCVISVLKITEMIEELCPQVTVQSVGLSCKNYAFLTITYYHSGFETRPLSSVHPDFPHPCPSAFDFP